MQNAAAVTRPRSHSQTLRASRPAACAARGIPVIADLAFKYVSGLAMTSVLMGALGQCAAPGRAAEPHSVPWFEQLPAAERSAYLKRCRDDMRLGLTPECLNAEIAEQRESARELARKHPPLPAAPAPPRATPAKPATPAPRPAPQGRMIPVRASAQAI